MNTKKNQKIQETVADGINFLKKLREKYDTPKAREFFDEIKNIQNKNEQGFNEAIVLFDKHITNINLTSEYKKFVLQYTIQIYNILKSTYKLIVQEESNEVKDSNTINRMNKNSITIVFYTSISFLYSNLVLNDKEKVVENFEEYKKHLENKPSKIPVVSFITVSTITLFILFIKTFLHNLPLGMSGFGILIFVFCTMCFHIISTIKNNLNIKQLMKTGDLVEDD